MYLTRKRRSWPIELPHIGEPLAGTYCLRKVINCSWACSSVVVDALTLAIRPLLPCVPLFQASILSSKASLWWITRTGPSMRHSRLGPVTMTAISMMRSTSGSRPVISQSSQTRFLSDLLKGVLVSAMPRIVAYRLNSHAMTELFASNPAPLTTTLVFAAALTLSLLLKFWLASRQIRHVAQH